MCHYLQLFQLFPGPIKVLCEDPEIVSWDNVQTLLGATEHWQAITWVQQWFHTYESEGKILWINPSHSMKYSMQWLCWDIVDCHNAAELFQTLVRHDLWPLLDWCYHLHSHLFEFDWIAVGKTYTQSANLPAIQWIVRNVNLSTTHWNTLLVQSCIHGHIRLVQWLWHTGSLATDLDIHHAFWATCEAGQLHIAQWMNSVAKISDKTWGTALRRSSSSGQLPTVQWLYDSRHQFDNEHATYDILFYCACTKGQLGVIQWLSTLYAYNAYECRSGFVKAALHGHVNVMSWIWDLAGHVIDEDTLMFLLAFNCRENRLEVVKWFFEPMQKIPFSVWFVFQESCSFGSINVAQWMLQNTKVDEISLRYGFWKSWENHKYHVTYWLYRISDKDLDDSVMIKHK